MSDKPIRNPKELSNATRYAVFEMRITLPFGPTFEYGRLVDTKFVDNEIAMSFYADDGMEALRRAMRDANSGLAVSERGTKDETRE